MPVSTDITSLSTTAASNSPADTEQRTTADDYFRQIHAFIATLYADKANIAGPTFTGTVTLPGGEAGYRKIVRVASTGETLATTMVGKCVATTGDMTVPNSTFAAGDAVSIYCNSSSAVSIIQGSGVTLRSAGTATTGTATLAAYGMATVWFNTASEAIVSGNI